MSKILIITNIRSGGTALCSYLKSSNIKCVEDPACTTLTELESIMDNTDCLKLSISQYDDAMYINILKFMISTYYLKIVVLFRNCHECASSVIRAKLLNTLLKNDDGYRVSYDISYIKNIVIDPFSINLLDIDKDATKNIRKYLKIKQYLESNLVDYKLLKFDTFFDKTDTIDIKYLKIKDLFEYIGYNFIPDNEIKYLFVESEIIYEKYCINYEEIKNYVNEKKDVQPF